jgi:hypothetical protein
MKEMHAIEINTEAQQCKKKTEGDKRKRWHRTHGRIRAAADGRSLVAYDQNMNAVNVPIFVR